MTTYNIIIVGCDCDLISQPHPTNNIIVPFLFHFTSFMWEPMSHLMPWKLNKAETAVHGR